MRIIKIEKSKRDIYAMLYSDLHYTPGDSLSFFKRSVDRLEFNRPNYIFFLGDLIDDSKYPKEELKKVLELVYKMSKVSKLLMVLGNHDQLTRNNDGKWIEFYNDDYVNELQNNGAIVLQNGIYQDDNIFVYGTRFSGDYYEKEEPISEFSKQIVLANFKASDKINILMEHSPKHTFDKKTVESFDNLSDVDLTLAGHFHNGCIPWYLDKVLPGNFGLIDPNLNVFPRNARGVKKINDTNHGIISLPLTTFSKSTRLNFIEPLYYPAEQKILIRKK